MKKELIFIFLLFSIVSIAQDIKKLGPYYSAKEEREILNVIENQAKAWNNGSLEGYMEGYWKSDSTRFMRKNGISYGWNETFESYKKGYPDKETMGTLTFKVISLEKLNGNSAFMIGKWDLDRKEKVGGYFSLIWKKINGKWLITTDHTS